MAPGVRYPFPVAHGSSRRVCSYVQYTSLLHAWCLDLKKCSFHSVRSCQQWVTVLDALEAMARVRAILHVLLMLVLVLMLMLCCVGSHCPGGHLAIRPMLAHCFSQQREGRPPQSWQDDSIAQSGNRSHVCNSSARLTEIFTTTHSLLTHLQYTWISHSFVNWRRHWQPVRRNELQHKEMIA